MITMNRLWATLLAGGVTIATAAGCHGGGDDGAAAKASAACPDTQSFFASEVWQGPLSTRCIGCHVAGGPAGGTRMVLSKNPADAQKNYETVAKIASLADAGGELLVAKPTAKVPHGGGAVLQEGSDGALVLAAFTDKVKGTCSSSGAATAQLNGRQIRRLTRDEYGNTVRDLLHVDGDYASKLPSDPVTGGFDNNAGALTVSTLFADKLRTNAEDIAKAVDLQTIVPCTPAAGKEADCAATFVRTFGERAFRRPLTDAEAARTMALYTQVAAGEGHEAGVRAVVNAALVSPSFLYTTELGETKDGGWDELTPWEIASELSYLFTRSMPDQALFDAARDGSLAKKDVIAAQAARLVALPSSRQAFARFVSQWLDLDKINQAVKDEKTYPNFDAALRTDLVDETVSLYDRVARDEQGSFKDLLTATSTQVTARVAQFYGLPAAPDGQLRPVADGRVGILTHGSILATQATPSSASPVRRGKLVRERFFCMPLAPPPPGVAAQLPPVDPSLPNRARFTEHSKNPACASCHKQMDPIGFGFEGFDGAGKPVANADVSGEILMTQGTDGPFHGVVDLQAKLAASAEVQECFVHQVLRFAYGIDDQGAAADAAKKIAGAFAANGTKLRALLVAFTQEDHFVKRHTDPDVGAPGPGAPPPPPPSQGPPPGSGGGGGDAGAPPPLGNDPNLVVDVKTQSQGGTAYQDDVTLTNKGTQPITWTVTLPKAGTIFNAWNTDYSESNGNFVFVGKDYDRTVSPGQTVTFGFQAK